MASVRPAWLVTGQWQCSYCGQSLRIGRMPDGSDWFRQGWMADDGRMVYRKSHHRGTADARTMEPSRSFPTPVPVVCRNRDCGEVVVVG